jgi:MYXO-CTERM domain-containing protein
MDTSAPWGAVLLILILVVAFARRGRRRVGSAASGIIYDLQSRDQRRATEIIVERRAESRDPETADGNLPDLEEPTGRSR